MNLPSDRQGLRGENERQPGLAGHGAGMDFSSQWQRKEAEHSWEAEARWPKNLAVVDQISPEAS